MRALFPDWEAYWPLVMYPEFRLSNGTGFKLVSVTFACKALYYVQVLQYARNIFTGKVTFNVKKHWYNQQI
jgi:hypothetical protein